MFDRLFERDVILDRVFHFALVERKSITGETVMWETDKEVVIDKKDGNF